VTAHDFHAWTRREPFAPFRVVTAGGRVYNVPAPHLILVSRDAVVIGRPGADLVASAFDVVLVRDVLRIEGDGAPPR
jgi:hypothetical protein